MLFPWIFMLGLTSFDFSDQTSKDMMGLNLFAGIGRVAITVMIENLAAKNQRMEELEDGWKRETGEEKVWVSMFRNIVLDTFDIFINNLRIEYQLDAKAEAEGFNRHNKSRNEFGGWTYTRANADGKTDMLSLNAKGEMLFYIEYVAGIEVARVEMAEIGNDGKVTGLINKKPVSDLSESDINIPANARYVLIERKLFNVEKEPGSGTTKPVVKPVIFIFFDEAFNRIGSILPGEGSFIINTGLVLPQEEQVGQAHLAMAKVEYEKYKELLAGVLGKSESDSIDTSSLAKRNFDIKVTPDSKDLTKARRVEISFNSILIMSVEYRDGQDL